MDVPPILLRQLIGHLPGQPRLFGHCQNVLRKQWSKRKYRASKPHRFLSFLIAARGTFSHVTIDVDAIHYKINPKLFVPKKIKKSSIKIKKKYSVNLMELFHRMSWLLFTINNSSSPMMGSKIPLVICAKRMISIFVS